MNRYLAAFVIALVAGACSAPASASEEEKAPQGKAIFTKYKCRACHAVKAEGIKKTGATSKTAKRKPPDLSGVGLERGHEWFEAFLQKKEKLDGRLHPVAFRGTKDEREALAAWLETMKTPKEGAGAPKPASATESAPATPPASAPPETTPPPGATDTTHHQH